MAFPHPGGGGPAAFHQAQVALPYSSSPSPALFTASHAYNPPHLSSQAYSNPPRRVRQQHQQPQPPPPQPSQHFQHPQLSQYPQQRQRRRGDGGGSRGHHHVPEVNTSTLPHQPFVDGQFDIFEWHTQFQSCVRYFLDHAQHTGPVQAVAAFVNIQLPFQKAGHPVTSSKPPPPPGSPGGGAGGPLTAAAGSSSSSSHRHHSTRGKAPVLGGGRPLLPPPPGQASSSTPPTGPLGQQHQHQQPMSYCTLTPYIRRLVATGFDFPAVLHGFFGDDWALGVGPLHEAERRNYLFAAKSDNWLHVKANYDMGEEQMVPFLKPLQNVSEGEIEGAELSWSEWLAMQDWMLGPRAPGVVGVGVGGGVGGVGGVGGGLNHNNPGGRRADIKQEEDDE